MYVVGSVLLKHVNLSSTVLELLKAGECEEAWKGLKPLALPGPRPEFLSPKAVTHHLESGLSHKEAAEPWGGNRASQLLLPFRPRRPGRTESEISLLGFSFSGALHMVYPRKQQNWSL